MQWGLCSLCFFLIPDNLHSDRVYNIFLEFNHQFKISVNFIPYNDISMRFVVGLYNLAFDQTTSNGPLTRWSPNEVCNPFGRLNSKDTDTWDGILKRSVLFICKLFQSGEKNRVYPFINMATLGVSSTNTNGV